MSKFYSGQADGAKPWFVFTEHGSGAARSLWTTTTSSHEGEGEESSTKSVSPFTTWHSAVRITRK